MTDMTSSTFNGSNAETVELSSRLPEIMPDYATSTPKAANRRITVHGLLAISSQIVWGAQGFITFMIAGRLLPQKEFGFVVVSNAILFSAQCLLLGPTTNPTLRLGAVSNGSVRITYAVYGIVTTAVCIAFLLLGAPLGRRIYAEPAFLTLIRYLSLPFASTSLYAIQKLVFFARMRYKTVLVMDILFTLVNIGILYALHANQMLSSAIGFYIARSAAAIVALIPVCAYAAIRRANPRTDKQFGYKDYFHHSGYSMISMLSSCGQGQVDALAVAHFLTPLSAATYGAAKIFYTGMTMVTNGLIMVALPASSRISRSGSGSLGKLYLRALLLAYAILLPGAAVLAALTGPLLRLCLGQRYLDASPIVRIFCLAALVLPISSVTDAVANGAGWWRRACIAAVTSGVVGMVASLSLTRTFGVTGAALSPVIALAAGSAVIGGLTWGRLGANGSAQGIAVSCVPALVEPAK